ncbi:MAG: di-heme oxidoredictase family protein [Myxococcales bacterium]
MANRKLLLPMVGMLAAFAGCGDEAALDDRSVTTVHGALTVQTLGSHLPGISDADFAAAAANFAAVEDLSDGLGPIFNERACGACHTNGALGGAGENTERRFGTLRNGFFDPLASEGGTLRQLFSVARFNNPNLPASSRRFPGNPTLCSVPVEVEPPDATIHNVGRQTTPLFGGGLVEAIPDSVIIGLQAIQPPAIRGVVSTVPLIFPNPADPTQHIGDLRVGRFGWKAGIATLVQFSADAYSNEMGITTQSCFRGTSILAFAVENAPNALSVPSATVPDGCDDLAPRNSAATAAAIGLPGPQGMETDDIVGSCADGRTEVQDDVAAFTTFVTFLAPPPRDFSDQISITRGQPLFAQVGCAGCHVETTFHTPAQPVNGVPGNFAFNPYSDFLLHDMGSLGDRIGSAPPDDPAQGGGDTIADTRRMRTAPLWGLRFRNRLLHDGRFSDVASAVRAHDGQGLAARNAFVNLSAADQHAVVQFVRSL